MKIICTLPNASELINGVAFKARGNAMVSEDVTQAVADAFAEIPGYQVLPDSKAPAIDSTAQVKEDAGEQSTKAPAKAAAKAPAKAAAESSTGAGTEPGTGSGAETPAA